MTEIKTEVELCRVAIEWLQAQHWEVYQEIEFQRGSPRADIVAIRGPAIWIIEAKMHLSIDLIEQALYWKPFGNYIGVLYPHRKKWQHGLRVLKQLGIGCIAVSRECGYVNHFDQSPFMRMPNHRREMIRALLTEDAKRNPLAEAGSNRLTWTPYKQTMTRVRRYLNKRGPATMKQIMADLKEHHYGDDKSALQCIRKGLSTWEDWCRIDRSGREYLYSVAEARE